jgi:hypothetical protein
MADSKTKERSKDEAWAKRSVVHKHTRIQARSRTVGTASKNGGQSEPPPLTPVLELSNPGRIDTLKHNSEQAYFFTSEWQVMEHEAETDLREGRYRDFGSMDDLLADLMEDE